VDHPSIQHNYITQNNNILYSQFKLTITHNVPKCLSFIHSFIPDISIAPLQVDYYSELTHFGRKVLNLAPSHHAPWTTPHNVPSHLS